MRKKGGDAKANPLEPVRNFTRRKNEALQAGAEERTMRKSSSHFGFRRSEELKKRNKKKGLGSIEARGFCGRIAFRIVEVGGKLSRKIRKLHIRITRRRGRGK